MRKLIIKRLLHIIPIIIGMSFISFLMIRFSPGSPFTSLRMNPEISPATIDALKKSFGWNKPPIIQYLDWLKNLCVLNFGISFSYHIPVLTLIKYHLKNTLCLALFSLSLSWVLAVPLGVIAGYREKKFIDKFLSSIAYISISLPSFFVALLFVYFISKTNILPLGGTRSLFGSHVTSYQHFIDYLSHLLVPGLVLTFVNLGWIFRLMRNNFIEVYHSPYITTAWAKGLSTKNVLFRHAFKNAINPMLTILGLEIGSLLNGAALTEIICGWPGMGILILHAVLSKDMYVVMGSLVISGALLILGNLIGDILLLLTDPRIKIS
ncbi:MAG: ABC transporter permease [Candidatus Omnitrophica bacterium]|nr:ABC transporter permease [Candidatus Omnitrophota bacterium]